MPHAEASRPAVAIIGAGWAGLACALQLVRNGFRPVVFESGPEPGGRARRAQIKNQWRDNGQHLMLSGCQALRCLCNDIGVSLIQKPFIYTDGTRGLSLTGRKGRFGLLAALFQAQGFSWFERLSLLRALLSLQRHDWQTPSHQTVAQWLSHTQQPTSLIKTFWEPLALAISNTPIDRASMPRFASVLRDTLGSGAGALDLLQPTADLSTCIVFPLIRAIESGGGEVRCHSRIRAITPMNDKGYKLSLTEGDPELDFDYVVLTVPPWSLKTITLPFNSELLAQRFGHQPIATVYLGFDETVRLPAPLFQLDGPTASDARIWAIDRADCGEPGVIAISLSAAGHWATLNHDDLALSCMDRLRIATGIHNPCLWQRVVSVRRATPEALPSARMQPNEQQPLPGLFLAGDWTHPDYPATLEAALQSGNATARQILSSK